MNPWQKGSATQLEGNANQQIPAKQTSALQKRGQESDWWHMAKDIYKTGPQGEGQKAWKAYQQARKNKPVHAERRKNEFSPSTTQTSTSQGSSRIPLNGRYIQSTLPRFPRKEPEPPFPSYKHPFGPDSPIHRILDISKALPPVRQLHPPPKPRRQNSSCVSKKSQLGHTSHPSSLTACNPSSKSPTPPTKDPWWCPRADKQTAKAQAALKAKISRPGPVVLSDDERSTHTCTTAVSAATASSQLTKHTHIQDFAYAKPAPLKRSRSGTMSTMPLPTPQRRQDTPPTHWLERFAPTSATLNRSLLHRPHVRRRNSDESFACRGLQVQTLAAVELVPEVLFGRSRS
ncbi:hypothetical protein IAQ61_001675 [Plenodomus lingam]|uniref:uncharacterized protein n=1 Tax=Leptosphaeria maculans TaxID=5022 RepID=UPI00332534F5|nr:hypothetical protein IAQ61_001675 [Plenodomus lingam]